MQHIYVVDDNPVAALRLTKVVSKTDDTRVVSFTDPVKALRDAVAAPPDLLLVDYAMPEMDGVRLIQELRRELPNQELAVAMVSGFTDPVVRSRALQAGALDVIAKPFDVIEVNLKVRNMLALTRQMRAGYQASAFADTQPNELLGSDDASSLALLARVAALRDENTGSHTTRMARYAHAVASVMGLTAIECELLLQAAPLHDIGKVGVPDAVLLKPASLSPEEWQVMRKHTWIGYHLLKDSLSPVLKLGAEIALNHHEQWDGSGYPRGLKGTNIPLSARIVAICDSFDALTTVRPYKGAWPLSKALAVIRADSGTHFDPKVVAAFNQALPRLLEIKKEVDGAEALNLLLDPPAANAAGH